MMEVPEDRLGQLLMLQVTASTGTGDTPAFIFHGAPLRDLLFQMEKVDDSKILFLQPNIRFRALLPPGEAGSFQTSNSERAPFGRSDAYTTTSGGGPCGRARTTRSSRSGYRTPSRNRTTSRPRDSAPFPAVVCSYRTRKSPLKRGPDEVWA